VNVSPDPEEIVQAEDEGYPRTPEPVVVCGPTETRELPAVRAGYRTETSVGTSVAVRLVPFEPRRKEAFIIAQTQDIWIASSQAGAQNGASGAMRIPAVVPYRIGHLDQVWACAVSGTTDISVECDYWSE
jgi:hypothetical protein